nr:O-antigen ligase family protein [Cytobacillus eiseniae]
MNDPNYFSVLQVTALVYFTRVKTIPLRFKYFAILILILSVLVSGSKTGIITLFSYFFIRIIEYTLISKEKKTKKIILQLSLIFALLAIAFIIIRGFPTLLNMLSSAVPAFSRIEPLFTDFDEAISGNGSDRADTWKVAYLIIQHSPLIGTGIGSYTHIAAETFYYNNVAHNTFLQITAEWGIPLAVLFFTFIGRLIVKSSNSRKSNFEMNYILRDILIILLIGSMAISLNNARVLWLVIGALLSSLGKKQTQRSLK